MRPERAQALKRGLPARSTAAPARRKGLVVGDGHISLTHRSEGTEPMAMSASTGLRTAGARTAEALRLEEIHRGVHWRRWGPYLSERQWGTVREDYSEHGEAWEFFPHDMRAAEPIAGARMESAALVTIIYCSASAS